MKRKDIVIQSANASTGYKDIVTERKILNTFMSTPESRKFLSRLIPQAFSSRSMGVLFSLIKDMNARNEPVNDMLYVTEKLKPKLQPFELAEVIDIIAPSIENEKYNEADSLLYGIQYIKELYFIRTASYIDSKILEAMIQRNVTQVVKLGDVFGKVYSSLFHIEEGTNYIQEAVTLINSKDEYVPTAFYKLNEMIGGWTKSDISSIGGKSGHNKTTFAIYDAVQSIISGFCTKVVYFSVDEPGEMIARRVIANLMNISLADMRNKKVQLDSNEVEKTLKTILKDRLIIIDNLFTAEAIQQAILDIKPERSIIDHIQEFDYGHEGISDQKVMVASKFLKEAARITHSNVTIISQVRDKLVDERFEDKIPRPHDFLYASDLRRKSREQCVVYWEYKDSQRDIDFQFFDLIVWKSTYSGTGRLKFLINPDLARFTDRAASRNQLEVPQTPEDVWKAIEKI